MQWKASYFSVPFALLLNIAAVAVVSCAGDSGSASPTNEASLSLRDGDWRPFYEPLDLYIDFARNAGGEDAARELTLWPGNIVEWRAVFDHLNGMHAVVPSISGMMFPYRIDGRELRNAQHAWSEFIEGSTRPNTKLLVNPNNQNAFDVEQLYFFGVPKDDKSLLNIPESVLPRERLESVKLEISAVSALNHPPGDMVVAVVKGQYKMFSTSEGILTSPATLTLLVLRVGGVAGVVSLQSE